MKIPLLDRVREVFREKGPVSLVSMGLAYAYREGLRPQLPATRRVSYAGVPTSVAVRRGDRWVPKTWIPKDVFDVPDYEATLIGELRRTVRAGDRVVVVGGGVGVTATVAAQLAGDKGRVEVFEGGAQGVHAVRQTAAMNGVADRVVVRHTVVGRAIEVWGRGQAAAVPPEALPDCDVLELDCEGAEADILRGMTIRPRAVVVETHGLYGAPTELVAQLLAEAGYDAEVIGLAEPRLRADCEAGDIRVVTGRRRDG